MIVDRMRHSVTHKRSVKSYQTAIGIQSQLLHSWELFLRIVRRALSPIYQRFSPETKSCIDLIRVAWLLRNNLANEDGLRTVLHLASNTERGDNHAICPPGVANVVLEVKRQKIDLLRLCGHHCKFLAVSTARFLASRGLQVPEIHQTVRGMSTDGLRRNVEVLATFLKRGVTVLDDTDESHQRSGISLQLLTKQLSSRQPLIALRRDEIPRAFHDRLRGSAIFFWGFSKVEAIHSFQDTTFMDEYSLLEYWEYMKHLPQPSPPAKLIPDALYDQFTLHGTIRVLSQYRNNTYAPETPLVYQRETIDSFLELINQREIGQYKITDTWLYAALDKYSILDKDVAIMGSTSPWYESICLAYGGRCTTVEYNRIVSEHPDVKTLTPQEYDKSPRTFDAAISISSFEHDGLGRYGDAINPAGDLQAMARMKSMLKPGGILFLAVPLGRDTLVWNVHRIYGRGRLPLLLDGWRVVDAFGFDETLLDRDTGRDASYQPIVVLQNATPIRDEHSQPSRLNQALHT